MSAAGEEAGSKVSFTSVSIKAMDGHREQRAREQTVGLQMKGNLPREPAKNTLHFPS